MQQSSLSSSSASSSISCTSLNSTVSCEHPPKSAVKCEQADFLRESHSTRYRFGEPGDGASRCLMQKNFSASREAILPNSNNSLLDCHGSGTFHRKFEGNSNRISLFEARPVPSANLNSVEHSSGGLLEEGQGECHGNHVSSSVHGLPSLWDDSEGSTERSWRRLSPAAVSCFCKDIEEEQEYFQQVLGSSSHGWTDEKHSSYLDSMEADFLRSVVFRGRDDSLLHTEPSSDLEDSANSQQAKGAAKEFMVCQSGKWRPVYVQASFVNVGPGKQLAVAVKNPWIKRFRASKRAYSPSLIMGDPSPSRIVES